MTPHFGIAQSMTGTVPFPGQPLYRTGDPVRIIGTGLAVNPCLKDTLILTWTVPTVRTLKLGRILTGNASSTVFSVTTGGGTDTIRFLMPAAVHCGNLSISLKKYAAGCNTTFSTVSLASPIPVGNKAIMNYPNGGVFCLNDTNGLPTKSEPGAFSSPTISSAFLTPSTGRLIIHSGLIGMHRIDFVANQDSNIAFTGCADATYDSIEIRPNGPAQSMSYPAGPYCGATPNFIALTSFPGVVGTFSSAPPGLWVDSIAGSIRPDSSTAGTYLVTFTPEHDACTAAITESVEVDSIRQIDFDYLTGICAFDNGLAPAITQYYPGRFVANALFGAVGNLSIDPSTGIIDATNVSSGTFEVIFEPDSTIVNCPDTSRVVVTVIPLPNPNFTIANDSACRNANDVPLTLQVPGTAGSFYDRSNVVTFTGAPAINVGATTGGPLAITFVATRTDSGVTCVDSTTRPFTVIGPQTAAVNYPIMSVCSGKPDTLSPVFVSGTLGGRFLIRSALANPPVIDPATGEIIISPNTTPGT